MMATGIDEINESLFILMKTALGERILQPEYGSALARLVFEPLNQGLMTKMKAFLQKAITKHEPRIKLESIDMEPNPDEGMLLIRIEYKLRSQNSRFNYVYPFYLEEANA